MKTKLLYLMLFVYSLSYAQFPTNGLIAQYGFDNGTLLVDGANAQNFTQIGTSLTEVNDRFNTTPTSAIKLNGDYLTRPDITIGEYYSYSFWIKTGTTSTARQVIIDDSNRNATNSSTWTGTRVTLNNGNVDVSIRYRISTSGSLSYRGLTSGSTIDVRDNKWHHITLLLKSRRYTNNNGFGAEGSTQIFVDGISQDFDDDRFGSSVIHTSVNRTGNLTIANDRDNTLPASERFDGEIDDLLIYGRTLSTTEIQSIMSYNNYCSAPSTSVVNVSGVTETTATVNITNNGSLYDIAYHKTSEPFSTATILTGITSGTATSLTSLDVFTDYNVYVREQCTNLSDWSDSIPFKTERIIGKLFVNKNATGDNNGSSWANAFTDLQDALTAVVAGEEIWIAQGTYIPHASSRSVFFTIDKENLKLYGGFSGTETQLSERIIGANETILSADLLGNDANVTDFLSNYTNTTRSSDNSYRVIAITANGNNLILDGLTISDAHNNSSTTSRGAAILKVPSVAYLTLRNCTVKDNVGRNDNAGLMAEFELTTATNGTGALNVENCKFINNMSRWGSGIYSFVRGNNNVDIKVINSLFEGNLAGDLGAANTGISGSASWFRSIANGSNVTLELTNNTYVNNQDLGSNSVNNFNRATVGISRNTSSLTGTFTAEVNNCIFWGNTTPNGVTTRSITDFHKSPLNSLVVRNSLDPLNFNDDSITGKTNTISTNPLFTSSSDYRLQSGSPAIDTGINSQVQIGSTDLLGNSRIFNATVDMGAYEFGSSLPVDRTLTINASNGTVNTNPNPTNGVYNDGSVVALTATPATGYQFDGWSGDETGNTNPLSVTMDADKTVTATFSLIPVVQHTLTLNNTNGSLIASPSPINGTYDNGTVVTLTPNPDANYMFLNWSGDIGTNSNTASSITITMDADKNITSHFSYIYYVLSTTANTQGTVSTSTPDRGSVEYISGSNVTLTAVPNTGYEFDSWSGDLTGTSNPITFTMDANKTITPVFKPKKFIITIGGNYSGLGTMSLSPIKPNNEYEYGDVVTFNSQPDAGYEFSVFAFGGGAVSTNPYNHTVTGNLTINPGFTKIQRTLTIIETNGTIAVSPTPSNVINNTGTFDHGTQITLTATPDSGYQFDGWSGDTSGTTNPLSITMDANKSVTAIFSQIQRTLNVTVIGNGTVTLASGAAINGTYADGAVISLTATAATGFGFTGWSGDATGTTNPLSITIDADKNITVTFSSTAGIEDINKFDFDMYPNPTKGNLTFDLNGQIKTIELFNLQGQIIKKFRTKEIDVSFISNGIYLVKITTKNGEIAIKKVVKN